MLKAALRSGIKAALARALSTDTLERLTEWAIEAHEPSVSLAGAEIIRRPGSSWEEIVEQGRREVWARTLARMENDILLLEFGSWKGDSMRSFVQLNSSPNSLFFGFDSFEGLPEDWRHFSADVFDVEGAVPIIDDSRVKFVKGWFRDTVPSLLDELAELAKGRSLLVHYDADLYSSTLYLLFALGFRFKRYHFIFDEFSGHETRALYNYLQATGGEAWFFHRLDWRDSPTIVSGELAIP